MTKHLFDCRTGQTPGQQECHDWYRFDKAARAAGYASGLEVANDHDLWDMTVDEAIDHVLQPGEADPTEWAKQIEGARDEG